MDFDKISVRLAFVLHTTICDVDYAVNYRSIGIARCLICECWDTSNTFVHEIESFYADDVAVVVSSVEFLLVIFPL